MNDIREAAPPIIYFPIAQNVGNIDGLRSAPRQILTGSLPRLGRQSLM